MIFSEIEKNLEKIGVEDYESEAMLVVEWAFGKSPAFIKASRDFEYDDGTLCEIFKKRKEKIPLQYIMGKWEIMGKEFFVSPDCLIPRPDTEILIERAIKEVKNGHRVADLCTGGGCIGISMLLYRGDISSMLLADISSSALNMARKNAKAHGVENRCEFYEGDIREWKPEGEFDMIVSNPPYIPSSHVDTLSDEVKKEPRLALDGGEDGLDIIRFLLGECLNFVKMGGKMLIEFGYDQGDVMDKMLRERRDSGAIYGYEILYDYGKNPRTAVITK